jgi:hypothetical protein
MDYDFPKHARDMSDDEYRAALDVIRRPGRHRVAPAVAPELPPPAPGTVTGTTSQIASAPAPATPVGQGRHARDMSPDEYAAALRALTRR